MPSPARAVRDRTAAKVLIEREGATTAAIYPEDSPEARQYAILMAELQNDLVEVKQNRSREAETAAKLEKLPKYTAHIDAAMETMAQTGLALQDEIFARIMVWEFDVGNFERALQMASFMLQYEIPMPANFAKTDTATFIVRQLSDAALAAQVRGTPIDIALLIRAEEKTRDYDMPDQARALLHKALATAYKDLAKSLEADSNDDTAKAAGYKSALFEAYSNFDRAFALDDKCGVKQDLERTKAKLDKLTTAKE